VDWQIKEGTHGVVPVGTTGESPTLSHDEHKRVVEIAVEVAKGRVPVIAGAGSNSTEEAIELTRHAKEAGANAALIVTLEHVEDKAGLVVQRPGKPPGEEADMVAFKGRQLGIEGGDVFGAVVVGKLSETEFGQHGGALLGGPLEVASSDIVQWGRRVSQPTTFGLLLTGLDLVLAHE
jgi:hypothetical protein